MWLHCEKEPGREPERANWEAGWPCAEALQSLWELNEQCLELLIEQSGSDCAIAPPLLGELHQLWSRLEATARRRAARCPYLLVDAGFAASQWDWHSMLQVADSAAPPRQKPFFTVPRVNSVAQQIYSVAWYLTRAHPAAVSLFLGMSAPCANVIRESTMRQIAQLAERDGAWIRPRWSSTPRLWRTMLEAAIGNDALALEKAQLQGVQLLATELRSANGVERERAERLARVSHYVK